jgi:hypothetical protein
MEENFDEIEGIKKGYGHDTTKNPKDPEKIRDIKKKSGDLDPDGLLFEQTEKQNEKEGNDAECNKLALTALLDRIEAARDVRARGLDKPPLLPGHSSLSSSPPLFLTCAYA